MTSSTGKTGLLRNTRDCPMYQDTVSQGNDAKCSLRVSHAEDQLWNGDYKIKAFNADNAYCPYYSRVRLDSIHDDLHPGFDHNDYNIVPPHLTNGKGWCMVRCGPSTSGWNRCPASGQRYVYCAPVCDASDCCLPAAGWRPVNGTGIGESSSSSLRIFSATETGFEKHLPPAPPVSPLPPQAPPQV